jgi:hypothetical protein
MITASLSLPFKEFNTSSVLVEFFSAAAYLLEDRLGRDCEKIIK